MAATGTKKVFELFVSKIPWTIANKEMREYFGQFGAVKRCLLPVDKETGFHKGICWVTYSTEESLTNALHTDPHVLEGAKLQVQRNNREPKFVSSSNRTQQHTEVQYSKDREYE